MRWEVELESQELIRGSGILLSISSLPSNYGIGALGKAAYNFVDLLVDLKQKYWQVLPVGPTSYGDSPYQSVSSCAGNHYLIDLDELVEEGLLTVEDIKCYSWGSNEDEIDYSLLFENRYKILKKAFEKFDTNLLEFEVFQSKNSDWLEDYALYMAIKMNNANRSWTEWPELEKNRQAVALVSCRKTYYNEIRFWMFCQFVFFKQWKKLKEYANYRGVQLIGEVPFYVGLDSADVWSYRDSFLISPNGKPSCVAAAVPDRFSEEGQVWGNPVYDWKKMQEDGFEWWKQRIRISQELFDVIRINHIAGMIKNYTVPFGAKNAIAGKWVKGPGRKLADALSKELTTAKIIADDYTGATLLPGVKKLLNKTGWTGTKVLMFAFDGNTSNEHLPHNYTSNNLVVYAGTHDNETIVGSFRDKTEYELAYLYEYLNIGCKEEIPDALIRAAYGSVAEIAIIQMQDMLKLGNEARMNAPSTIGANWKWRLSTSQLEESRREWLRNLAAVFRR